MDAIAKARSEAVSVKQAVGGVKPGSDEDAPEETAVEKELRALRAEVSSLKQQLTPTQVRSKMTDKEKSDYMRKHGFNEYRKLPWD